MISRTRMACAADRKLGIAESETIRRPAQNNRDRLEHLDRRAQERLVVWLVIREQQPPRRIGDGH